MRVNRSFNAKIKGQPRGRQPSTGVRNMCDRCGIEVKYSVGIYTTLCDRCLDIPVKHLVEK